MALGDLTRINTNINAFNALAALKRIGNQLGTTQLRLQTGKRINEAADDPAGFSIGSKFDARARGMAVALDGVGTTTNVLGIAEGGMQAVHDTLLSIRDLIAQATSSNLGTDERTAIESQLDAFSDEISRLRDQTTFAAQKLLDGTFTGKRVQTGPEATDSILVSLTQDFSLASLGIADASLAVDTVANASLSLTYVDTALSSARTAVQNVGATVGRLRVIEDSLTIGITNTQAAKARIMDADVAAEQVNSVRLQILQQLATAQLSQANSQPQTILALFQ
jgi:flagellin